ncbi:MAG: VWA domain-containing protein [Planctomycetes bacterium]|nr:VWA domain-containing protein [Planctomycetota bacterium]
MTRPFVFVNTLVALLLIAAVLPAQEAEFKKARKDFERAQKREEVEPRLDALRAMMRVADPEIADAIVEAIVEVSERIEDSEDKIKKTEEKIAEEIYKRVEKPKVNATQKREAMEKTKEKLAPEYKRIEDLQVLVASDLAVREALEKALPEAASAFATEEKEAAATMIATRLAKSKKGQASVHYARALGAIQHPAAKAALIEQAANSLYPSVRVVCLDSLLGYADDEAEGAGIRGLGDEHRQVRSAAIGLLRTIGSKLAVAAAIDSLEKAEGATKGELRALLKHLCKFDFNDNVTLWRRWWDENRQNFDGRGEYAGIPGHDRPPREGGPGAAGGGGGDAQGGTNFYGIETTSKNIVYVLDISGSMTNSMDGRTQPAPIEEQRIKKAVSELVRSISSLPGDATFNIVFYESQVYQWRDGMQAASKANKDAARDWANRVVANNQTNIYDALEMAFGFAGRGSYDKHYDVAVDTIFLLSDGSANQGRYTKNEDMLAGVARLNALAKITINAIAIGSDSGFMRQLAEQNRGQFVLVRN